MPCASLAAIASACHSRSPVRLAHPNRPVLLPIASISCSFFAAPIHKAVRNPFSCNTYKNEGGGSPNPSRTNFSPPFFTGPNSTLSSELRFASKPNRSLAAKCFIFRLFRTLLHLPNTSRFHFLASESAPSTHRFMAKSFRIISFADTSHLTPLESHLFEKQGEGGNSSCASHAIHDFLP